MTVNQSLREQVVQAIARGWCSPENATKVMDSALVASIADQLLPLIQQLLEGAEQAGHIDGHACAGSNLPCDRWKGALDRLLEAARAEGYSKGYADGERDSNPPLDAEGHPYGPMSGD